MHRSMEFIQTIARAITHTTWNIPRIKQSDTWRNICNPHLVENPAHFNGYDRFEGVLFRIKTPMGNRGWQVSTASETEPCHEPLHSRRYRLLCRR